MYKNEEEPQRIKCTYNMHALYFRLCCLFDDNNRPCIQMYIIIMTMTMKPVYMHSRANGQSIWIMSIEHRTFMRKDRMSTTFGQRVQRSLKHGMHDWSFQSPFAFMFDFRLKIYNKIHKMCTTSQSKVIAFHMRDNLFDRFYVALCLRSETEISLAQTETNLLKINWIVYTNRRRRRRLICES